MFLVRRSTCTPATLSHAEWGALALVPCCCIYTAHAPTAADTAGTSASKNEAAQTEAIASFLFTIIRMMDGERLGFNAKRAKDHEKVHACIASTNEEEVATATTLDCIARHAPLGHIVRSLRGHRSGNTPYG